MYGDGERISDVLLRKNKNGVDTNRNYQVFNRHPYSPDSEEYQGPHHFQKESQLVASLLKRGTQRYINVHSCYTVCTCHTIR